MIGVLGPGGIGGLLAARFAAAGHDVTIVASESTAAEITARGLRFTAPDAAEVVSYPTARTYLASPVDVLFVAVKATDLVPALQRIPAKTLGNATVVPFLNGVDHMPLLRATYPEANVVGATIAVEATRHRPGVIEQVSPMANVTITEGSDVAELLSKAGFDVATHPDENTVLWRKLVFLAPFALLTTGLNAPLGEAVEKHGDRLHLLIREAAAAAASQGADVDADAIEARLRGMPPTFRSSMLKDFIDGRALELDAIAGPIIRALGRDNAPTTVDAVSTILAS
ncbi:2-dehydropantoate 2-reductase [Kibdelosporangium philippinense]|uniref:2-dehydropantoate 2-reductase n=1 Tax=Kibdelosporangium philippinense TaxID=211113 RepID=A0ABS8ZV34_9PSEU|nr:2-dehydropantoate 2-reductase [Kibdelosporangium philippinense]MCE7011113.1 2-dehydropantoate 2-reductase [Kibdelosporangium philippinense]